MRERPYRDMNPMMETALRATTRGPLIREEHNWVSNVGVDGEWNTHTMMWMAGQGWIVLGEEVADILPAGRAALRRREEMVGFA